MGECLSTDPAGVGLRCTGVYNTGMKLKTGPTRAAVVVALLAALLLAGCSGRDNLPKDANLELYIATSAKCAYVDRAFSNDPELFREEIAEVNLPENWKAISDSLLDAYGSDVRFWYRVYSEIAERSRR